MTELRNHLNKIGAPGSRPSGDDTSYSPQLTGDADDDQTMTGLMGATALNVDDDGDADEELDDADARDAQTLFGVGPFHPPEET